MGRVYGRSRTAVTGDGRHQEREGGDGQAGAADPDPVATLTAFATDLLKLLLGEPPPRPGALAEHARVAVERFLALTAASK